MRNAENQKPTEFKRETCNVRHNCPNDSIASKVKGADNKQQNDGSK